MKRTLTVITDLGRTSRRKQFDSNLSSKVAARVRSRRKPEEGKSSATYTTTRIGSQLAELIGGQKCLSPGALDTP